MSVSEAVTAVAATSPSTSAQLVVAHSILGLLTVWHEYHTIDGMKMTLHIDDALLARVMDATGARSKTQAVDLALREMDRRASLAKLAASGLGLGPEELKETVNPAYDLAAIRKLETPMTYGRKSSARR